MSLPETQEALDAIIKERLARQEEGLNKKHSEELDKFKSEHATQLKELQGKVTEAEGKLKDVESWKASHEKLPSLQQQLDETAAKLESSSTASEALNSALEAIKGNISTENKHRIPEGLEPAKMLQWFVANSDLVFGKAFGNTPPVDTAKPADGGGGLIEGKYASEAEFMKADPPGFIKWAQSHPAQGGWE